MRKESNKVLIIINNLAGGGAERVVYHLSKVLEKYKIVTLVEHAIEYPIPEHNVHFLLGSNRISKKILPEFLQKSFDFFNALIKLYLFKRRFKPSVSISLLEPANMLNILSKNKECVILSFHNTYSEQFHKLDVQMFGNSVLSRYLKRLYIALMKFLYNKADKMVVVSYGSMKDLEKSFNLDSSKMKVIHNPLDIEEIEMKKREDLGKHESIFENSRIIINVGRLSVAKGQCYLIRIFKLLKEEFHDIKLVILGKGELKENLVSLSNKLGLRTFVWDMDKVGENYDVYFLGFQENPYKYLTRSTLYVSTSLWEGFPVSLIEALACGLPVISTDCRSGPREILAPGTDYNKQTDIPEFCQYGILMPVFEKDFITHNEPYTPNELLWAKTLSEVIKDEQQLKTYASFAPERAKEFSLNKVIQEWFELIY